MSKPSRGAGTPTAMSARVAPFYGDAEAQG